MFAVAVPASAPHGSQNIHSSLLVRHGALDPGKPFVNVLIAVKVLHVSLVVIVAGLNDKIGHPLEVAVSFRLDGFENVDIIQHTCQNVCSLSLCSERALKALSFLEATFTS